MQNVSANVSLRILVCLYFFLHFNFAYHTNKAPYNKSLQQTRIRWLWHLWFCLWNGISPYHIIILIYDLVPGIIFIGQDVEVLLWCHNFLLFFPGMWSIRSIRTGMMTRVWQEEEGVASSAYPRPPLSPTSLPSPSPLSNRRPCSPTPCPWLEWAGEDQVCLV